MTVIDGSTGILLDIYQEALVNIKIQENAATAKVPKYIEGARKLPWTGSYINASECHLSYMMLVNACFCMHKYIEGIQPIPHSNEVIEAGSAIIMHLPESGRSDKLFRKTDINFLSGITMG